MTVYLGADVDKLTRPGLKTAGHSNWVEKLTGQSHTCQLAHLKILHTVWLSFLQVEGDGRQRYKCYVTLFIFCNYAWYRTACYLQMYNTAI